MKFYQIICACLLLTCLTGCLEVDGQDVYLRCDEESDRIDIMLVHRGMFAEGSEDSLEKAVDDLHKAMASGKFIFWNNWPMAVDLTKNALAPLKPLAGHLEVENGHLFTDPLGVLCGYQFVRINKAKSFIKKVNMMIEVAIQAACLTGIKDLDGHKLDDESRENIREFLRERGQYLTVQGGRIELQVPLSKADHKLFKRELVKGLSEAIPRDIIRRVAVAERRRDGGSVTKTTASASDVNIEGVALEEQFRSAPTHQFIWDNDFSIQRASNLTTIGLGVEGDDELHIVKKSGGLYHEALLSNLREDDTFEIEVGVPDQALHRRFEDFLTREAKLPPLLADQRTGNDDK
jgi:hypothetical protein